MAMSPQATGGRRPFFRRRKSCPFSGANAPKIDYKDVKLLQRFVSELNWEISVCGRLRGGPERTRTSNQTIISRQL
jgi:ribosomal protein S18